MIKVGYLGFRLHILLPNSYRDSHTSMTKNENCKDLNDSGSDSDSFKSGVLNSGSRDPFSCRNKLKPGLNTPTCNSVVIMKTLVSLFKCV